MAPLREPTRLSSSSLILTYIYVQDEREGEREREREERRQRDTVTAGAGNRGPLTHDKLPIGNGWTRGRTCLARVLLLLLRLPPRSHPFEQFILRREFSDLAVQCLSEKFREERERERERGITEIFWSERVVILDGLVVGWWRVSAFIVRIIVWLIR